jgi:hypothetical protein
MQSAEIYDRMVHDAWSAPQTHERIREYMARVTRR